MSRKWKLIRVEVYSLANYSWQTYMVHNGLLQNKIKTVTLFKTANVQPYPSPEEKLSRFFSGEGTATRRLYLKLTINTWNK